MHKVIDKQKRKSIWVKEGIGIDGYVDFNDGEAMVGDAEAWALKHLDDIDIEPFIVPFNPQTWTPEYKKIIWDTSVIAQANGYGSVSELAIKAMDALGVDVYTPAKIVDEDTQRDRLGEIARKAIQPDAVTIMYGLPDAYDRVTSEKRFGYTMFENTVLPENWVEQCNAVTGMIAPSEWVKELFIENGIKVPVLTYLHGVNQEYYHYMERPERDTYTFLDFGAPLSIRKGAEYLYKAFELAFPTESDVRLHIKTTEPFWLWGGMDDPRVKVTYHPASIEDMQKILFDADCMLFPTHGEGFGLPPLQAMATGLPTLVTNWSGCTEYAKEEYCLPLDYTLEDSPHWNTGGKWADVKIDDLVDKMRWCYNNRKAAQELGRKASEYVAKEWTWEKVTKDFLLQLEKFI